MNGSVKLVHCTFTPTFQSFSGCWIWLWIWDSGVDSDAFICTNNPNQSKIIKQIKQTGCNQGNVCNCLFSFWKFSVDIFLGSKITFFYTFSAWNSTVALSYINLFPSNDECPFVVSFFSDIVLDLLVWQQRCIDIDSGMHRLSMVSQVISRSTEKYIT